MAEPRSNTPPSLADQVALLTQEVDHDRAHRKKASEERAQHAASVDTWLSRKRTVLVAFVLAIPILGLLMWSNVTGNSLVDLLTPDPPAALGRQRAQEALDAAVKEVAAYRQAYSRLPDSLAEVGVARGEWSYSRGANGNYKIALNLYGQNVAFDSRAGRERQH